MPAYSLRATTARVAAQKRALYGLAIQYALYQHFAGLLEDGVLSVADAAGLLRRDSLRWMVKNNTWYTFWHAVCGVEHGHGYDTLVLEDEEGSVLPWAGCPELRWLSLQNQVLKDLRSDGWAL